MFEKQNSLWWRAVIDVSRPALNLTTFSCRNLTSPSGTTSTFSNNENKPIIVETLEGNDKGICIMSLNNPKVNALSGKLLNAMQECLKKI